MKQQHALGSWAKPMSRQSMQLIKGGHHFKPIWLCNRLAEVCYVTKAECEAECTNGCERFSVCP